MSASARDAVSEASQIIDRRACPGAELRVECGSNGADSGLAENACRPCQTVHDRLDRRPVWSVLKGSGQSKAVGLHALAEGDLQLMQRIVTHPQAPRRSPRIWSARVIGSNGLVITPTAPNSR